MREAGRSDKEPGKLKETKGLGWFVDEYNMAQVSMNLNNYKVTAVYTAFEEFKKAAEELNVAVAGSELVGLVPLEAMLMAADYYIKKENLMIVDEQQKIRLVVERLGLNSVSHFDPKKRIIEYMIKEENNEPLASLTLRGFIEEVANRSSAPGGGSASAAISAMGVGLGCMVAQLTYGIRKFENVDKEIRNIVPPLYSTVKKLIPMIDADTNALMTIWRLCACQKIQTKKKKLETKLCKRGKKSYRSAINYYEIC